MLSKRCTYGIQALMYVAAVEQEGFVPIRRISDDLGISHPFLAKIVQDLARSGILESLRGPNGGVRMGVPAERLTIKQLILALDGPALFEACVLGLPGCGSEKPCPMHDTWKEVRSGIDTSLSDVTIAELAGGLRTLEVPLVEPRVFLSKKKTLKS